MYTVSHNPDEIAKMSKEDKEISRITDPSQSKRIACVKILLAAG
jgi:hypothetical protein